MQRVDGVGAFLHYALGGGAGRAVAAAYVFDTAGAASVPGTVGQFADYVLRQVGDEVAVRGRIVRTPLGLDNPVWVDDPGFDIRDRVHERRVRGSGGWQEVCAELVRIAEEAREPDVPVEFFLLRGVDAQPQLPRGALVVVLRFDHAAMDGVAAVAFARKLFPEQPGPWDRGAPAVHTPLAAPSRPAMVVDAVTALPNRVAAGASLLRKSWEVVQQRKATAGSGAPTSSAAPLTVLDTVTATRRVALAVAVPMAVVRRARAAVAGATVNDVALAAVAHALRAYLLEFAELPREPLRCHMPVALAGGEGRSLGNSFTRVTVPLWTNVADAGARLRLIHESAASAKESVADGPGPLLQAGLTTLSAPLAARLAVRAARAELAGKAPRPANVVVTNVPRGPQPLFLGDARAVRVHAVPIFPPGSPMTHHVTNLEDTMMVTVVADESALWHPQRYQELLEAAFAQLGAAPGG